MSQQIRGQGGHLVFPIVPKNTNLVEELEILLPVKFLPIQFSGFRGEVKNVSANQRPGGHLGFPMGPKNTNLVEHIEILLPVKFRRIPFSGFRGEVKSVSANQSSGRPSCFSDRPEKHKLGRGRWDPSSCQILFEFCSAVSEEKSKMWKLTTDGRTDDGQRTTIVHLSLRFRCTKKSCVSKHIEVFFLVATAILSFI